MYFDFDNFLDEENCSFNYKTDKIDEIFGMITDNAS